jgi:tape measure domain-containing protein
MASVADLIARLRIDTSAFASGLEDAASRVNGFGKKLSQSLNVTTVPIDVQKFRAIEAYADRHNISMDKARQQLGYTRGEYRGLVEAQRNYNAEIQKSKFGWKDVGRIIQGIIVAKIFYSGMQAIQRATDAVWEFSKALEYSQITYANLFGDVQLSNEFVNVLQDYAAETVFSFSEAEAAARRLLSYGVQYKNVMYIMQGVMAGATVTGNKQNIERISRALGQIYTKGRLMGEEMRQLAEAGVPAYEILIEKLGLTQKQLQNLGRESIPASKAINALVDGINERFGGVVNAAAFTTIGLINKIQDNALMLANGIFQPVLNKIKSFLATFANWLSDLREIYNKSGVGGVFESIVPEHARTSLRTFVANMVNMFSSFAGALEPIGATLAYIGHVIVNVTNMIAPVITFINTFLSALASKLMGAQVSVNILAVAFSIATGALVIFLANLLRVGIVKIFTSAVVALGAALRWLGAMLASHPIVFFMSLLAVGAGALAATNTKLGQSIRNLISDYTALSGVDPDKVLMPESKERAADLGKFNERLDDTADAMNDVADKTGKAAKAGKALLSFDEVFRINEPDENKGGAGISDALDDALKGLEGLGGVEMPSFDEFSLKLKNKLFDSIKERITSTALGTLIGGVIGAAIGSLVGNPVIGAKIGAAVGAIAGYFWPELSKKLEEVGLLQENNISMAIGGVVGGAIGAVLGGPAGAIIGAAIGTLATGLANMLWTKLAEVLGKSEADAQNASVGASIGAAIGAVIGAIIGGPGGAAIGAGIGLLVAGLVGMFWEEIKNAFTTKSGQVDLVSMSIGTTVGAVIGGVLGGPAGAILGAGIGYFATQLVKMLWQKLADAIGKDDTAVTNATIGMSWGAGIGGAIGAIIGGPGGALIGAGIGALVGGIVGFFLEDIKAGFSNIGNAIGEWCTNTINGIKEYFNPEADTFGGWLTSSYNAFSDWSNETLLLYAGWWENAYKGFSDWYNNTVKIFSDWDSITGDTLGNWWKDTTKRLSDWSNETVEGYAKWSADTMEGFLKWRENNGLLFDKWKESTTTAIDKWCTDTVKAYAEWSTGVTEKFLLWRENNGLLFDKWKADTGKKVSNWCNETVLAYAKWSEDVLKKFFNWRSGSKKEVDGSTTENEGTIDVWKTNVINKFTEFSDGAIKVIGGFAIASKEAFGKWWSETWTNFDGWFTQLKTDIKNWWNNCWVVTTWNSGWSSVSSWFAGVKTNISAWFTERKTDVKDWWAGLWDTSKWKSGWDLLKQWFSNLLTSIGDWFTSIKTTVSSWWNNLWSDKKVEVDSSGGSGGSFSIKQGHATGGIFNKEHIARFAEGNKAEAVIPLENASAMQPFVDAISNGLVQSLAPTLAAVGAGASGSSLPPMYVGTLIADERSLKELEKRMRIIRTQENARRGN